MIADPNTKGDYQVCQTCLGHIRRARVPPPMSSLLPTPTPSYTKPAPSPTDSEFSTHGAANYFFGFLFLFAVILLILVGCGIGTRRRLLTGRRSNTQTSLEPWGLSGLKGEVSLPQLHETTFVLRRAAGWNDIVPLSAEYLVDNEQDLNEKSATDESTQSLPLDVPPSNQLPPSSEPISSSFPYTFLSRKTPSSTKLASPRVTAIRVAILIAMPSPREGHQALGPGDQQATSAPAGFSRESDLSMKAPAEVQIAVGTLPWRES